MSSSNRSYPLTPRSLRRLALMQRCFELGEAEERGALLWRAGDTSWHGPWVSGGLNQLVELVDGFRVHPSVLTGLKDTNSFSPDFIERLRGARAAVDIAGVEEGDLIDAGSMILELEGSNFNCMLVSTLAELSVGVGTEVLSRAFALRRSHKDSKLVLQSPRKGYEAIALTAAQTTEWDGVADRDLAEQSALPLFQAESSADARVQLADPTDIIEHGLSSSWAWEWSSMSPEYAAFAKDLKLRTGQASRRTYRLLNVDGTRAEDVEHPTGTKLSGTMRKIVQRYADRGHPCRPLPDTMRIRALHSRAIFEFDG